MIQGIRFGAHYAFTPNNDSAKRKFDAAFQSPKVAAMFSSEQMEHPLFREFGGRALSIDFNTKTIHLKTGTDPDISAKEGLDDAQVLNFVARQIDDRLEISSSDNSCVMGVNGFISLCFSKQANQRVNSENGDRIKISFSA